MTEIKVGDVTFQLREPHDFSWLSTLGRVFCVYPLQDSGNLLFGVERAGERLFVKYAGAKPIEYEGEPEDAIQRLEQAAERYKALRHPDLIAMREVIRCPAGLAAIYEWFDGRGLHEAWTFDQCDKYTHPDSAYYQFQRLPVKKKLCAVEAIFRFLMHCEAIGYVAVDFYDGSIMYDFKTDRVQICDIDFFQKKPLINRMGKDFWGTKRLKAPEEYCAGAVIDSVTNVYTLGALLFHFFGSYTPKELELMYAQDRFFPCATETWTLGEAYYRVAAQAACDERQERYPSLAAFYRAWTQAKDEQK